MAASEDEETPEPDAGLGLAALSERTADMTEDIEEYAEVAQAIQAVEAQEQAAEEIKEAEEETV